MQSDSLVMQLLREIIPTGEDYCENVRKDQNAGRFETSDTFST